MKGNLPVAVIGCFSHLLPQDGLGQVQIAGPHCWHVTNVISNLTVVTFPWAKHRVLAQCELFGHLIHIYCMFPVVSNLLADCPDWQLANLYCKYTVKNIALYQLDLTTQHRSNGKGNIVLKRKVKSNHSKMYLLHWCKNPTCNKMNYLLVNRSTFFHSCKWIIIVNLKSTISMLEQKEKHT